MLFYGRCLVLNMQMFNWVKVEVGDGTRWSNQLPGYRVWCLNSRLQTQVSPSSNASLRMYAQFFVHRNIFEYAFTLLLLWWTLMSFSCSSSKFSCQTPNSTILEAQISPESSDQKKGFEAPTLWQFIQDVGTVAAVLCCLLLWEKKEASRSLLL